ncbi:Rhodanese-like domain-containing protein, partial [Aspergillus ambiguus]|uniref:rhodanese-like domain-containing protein n=1 Tax=Aspergillus ambiguus TaxID=176160 RepID=UPI003CCD8C0E
MTSPISLRRPLTGLFSRAAKQPAFTASAIRPRQITSLVQQPPRAVPGTAISTSHPRPLKPVSLQTIRRRSNNSGELELRRWGFEDITAALPSDSGSASPSHSPNLILVDVREPAELTATGIIPSAVSVPLASQPDALFLTPDEFETRFGYPKPGVEGQTGDVVFYCKAGVRARAAAQLAVQAGYEPERVGVYEGSWLDWADRGGRVEKWEGPDY